MIRYRKHIVELPKDKTKIDVNSIYPDPKDIVRAEGLLILRGKVDTSPFRSNASKMSKLITNPIKLIRRAKAISSMYGYGDYFPLAPGKVIDQDSNVFAPFVVRLQEMGFSKKQINDIAGWKLDPLIKHRQEKMANIMLKIKNQSDDKKV